MGLRETSVRWYIAALLLALMVLLFGTVLAHNHREMQSLLAEEQRLRTEIAKAGEHERTLRLQLNGASGGSTAASDARAMSFVLPDEVCFQVTNPDLLDMYTEGEWQILQEERQLGLR